MSHILTAAIGYANMGWPVFMLGRNKRPVANCQPCHHAPSDHDPQACKCLTCHGFYAATRDPKTIARIIAVTAGGMLAIRTGTASRLVVVDVDPDKGGTASLAQLVAEGLLPATRYVRTGSGGLHLYYRHPGPHTKIRCSQSVLAPGLDVRADGGYVVAPPSVHPRTRRLYVWADADAPVVEMPPALITACQLATAPTAPQNFPSNPPPARTQTANLSAGAGGITSPERLLSAHLDAVRHAPEGRRRTTLYGASRGVARMVAAGAITCTDAHAALLGVGLAAGQTERDCLAAITGGFKDEGVSL